MRSFRPRVSPFEVVTDPIWPLAGVLFALVVFFVVRLSLNASSRLEAAGTSGAALAPDAAPIVVRLTNAGTIHSKGKRLELSSVRATVIEARSRTPGAPLVVVADEGAKASLMARVIDQIRLSGATDIRVVVQEEGDRNDP